MQQGTRQPNWDIYEAVILLDGYLESLQGKQPRARIIKRISADLRQMAMNRDRVIDDVYRNENGISYQMESMESAYKGAKVYVPATKLFRETVELYRTDSGKYNQMLDEARSMIVAKCNTHDAFLGWVASQYGDLRCKWLEENIQQMEKFAIASKRITTSIYDVVDADTLDAVYVASKKNKIFQIRNKKLINRINEDFELYIKYCAQLHDTRAEQKEETKETDVLASREMPVSCESRYHIFLLNVVGLSESSCHVYESSIRSAERYAADHGYASCELFSESRDVIEATVRELYNDGNFVNLNKQGHNRYRGAINRLLESIDAEIPSMEATDNVATGQSDPGTKRRTDVVAVLRKYYEYGFRLDSIRELMRFRQFADEMGIILRESDEALKNAIISSGTVIEGKVYCNSDNMSQELRCMIEDAFSTGATVIYYESLFELNREWMETHKVISVDILKEYLQKASTGCSLSKKFMVKGARCTEKDAVTAELIRVWDDDPVENVHNLHNRLPYIPLANIWRVISGNDRFVLVDEGEYLFIDRFLITDEEEKEILRFVRGACAENGFASLSDVPIGDIEENNYELSLVTIRNAIYKKTLSSRYFLNGKILTDDNSRLDAVTLLKREIAGRDECTFDEIADKVIGLTGATNRQYAFQALYDEMVRIDRNRFVANQLVDFRIDEIDARLTEFISDHFRAIRDVTTFAMFPICGQSWNHYLLESFCYKYSKKFSLHVMHFNDKNAGIIAEKDFCKGYNDMLAMELARSDTELSSDTVGEYLFNTGYMAKRKYSKFDEITQKAIELRKER